MIPFPGQFISLSFDYGRLWILFCNWLIYFLLPWMSHAVVVFLGWWKSVVSIFVGISDLDGYVLADSTGPCTHLCKMVGKLCRQDKIHSKTFWAEKGNSTCPSENGHCYVSVVHSVRDRIRLCSRIFTG